MRFMAEIAEPCRLVWVLRKRDRRAFAAIAYFAQSYREHVTDLLRFSVIAIPGSIRCMLF